MARVMVISGGGPSLATRLRPFIEILRSQGLIEGYTVFDHQGLPQGPDMFPTYDAVLVHQVLPRNLRAVFARRKLRFIFDADDVPVSALSRFGGAGTGATPLRETLFLAGTVISPCRQLPEVLAWHCNLPVPKAQFVPYAFPGGDMPRGGPLKGVVYSSWAGTFLEESRAPVLAAINAFAAERGVPVFNCSPETGLFANEHSLSGLAGWALEAHLRSLGPLIAAVPMETIGGPFLKDYLLCRADLEKAFYGSLGVPGVYSDSLPFAHSDLVTGVAVANDRDAWIAALRLAAERMADPAFANRQGVLAQRNPEMVANQCLGPVLLDSAGLGQRIRPADLLAVGG